MERNDFEREFERMSKYHKFGFVWIEINDTEMIRADRYVFSADGYSVWLYLSQDRIGLIRLKHIIGIIPYCEEVGE